MGRNSLTKTRFSTFAEQSKTRQTREVIVGQGLLIQESSFPLLADLVELAVDRSLGAV